MSKRLLSKFIQATAPLVQRIARAYDLRVERPGDPHGQHPLIFKQPDALRHNVPKSVYFNTRSGSITVGSDTLFGENVSVLTGKHMHAREARSAGVPLHHVPESGRDIVIGAGCYIGTGAIIIGPVHIGDGAVVGAGAVVTKDVPASAFVGGIPARVIRRIDDD